MADIWSAIYWGDYGRKTAHLSLMEHGAYLLLMKHYYSTGCPLPADFSALHRVTCAQTDDERLAVESVIRQFFILEDSKYHNRRIDEELDKASAKSKIRATAADAKWGRGDGERQRIASLTRSQRLAAARALGTHTDAEWWALVVVCDSICVRCKNACKTPAGTPTVVRDHIKPIYQGGSDGIDNIQPLCSSCNSSKGAESIDYRPMDWNERLQKCLQNASQPQPQSQPYLQPPFLSSQAPKAKKGTRLPEAFRVSDEHREWALRNALPSPDDHIEAFQDYWKSQPGQRGVKLDWDATFRNWLRKAVERRNGNGKARPDILDSVRKAISELES